MVKKQTKIYQAPTVKVVQFMIERGLEVSVDTVEDGEGENTLGQYNEASSTWSGYFGTDGEEGSHF